MNKPWIRIKFFFGMIASLIGLGLVFFGLITPLALVMRLFGRDELCLKIRKDKSHWSQRKTKIGSGSFESQF